MVKEAMGDGYIKAKGETGKGRTTRAKVRSILSLRAIQRSVAMDGLIEGMCRKTSGIMSKRYILTYSGKSQIT